MPDFDEVTKSAKKFIEEREWDKFRTAKDEAVDVVVEASEVLEHFQWKNPQELEEYINTHKQEIADEVADVLFGLVLLADKLGISLKDAFYEKLRKTAEKYPVEKCRGKRRKWSEN